jgi:hypothetical protein
MCKNTTIPLAAFAATLCVPQTIVSDIHLICFVHIFIIMIKSSIVGATIIPGTFASLSSPCRNHATDEAEMVTDTLVYSSGGIGGAGIIRPRYDANLLVGKSMN